MANIDLVMRLLAEDRASDKFRKVGDSATAAEKRLDKFRKVAGGISATAIAAFAATSVKAFDEAEAQQVKLESAYKRFPKIADVSIASLRDMNSELQRTTTFDDDAVAGAQAVLAQFNLTGEQIKQVTPLLLDYAAATGKDVADAATSLGKSFLGQTRALKEVGISYKSTGDAGKDFANITDLLSQKVGGFAQDQGKTAAGQLAILSNQFGDLQEAVGGALVPALTSLVGVAKPVVEVIGKLPAPVLGTALAVGAVGTAALVAVPKIVSFKVAMTEAGVSGDKMKGGLRGAAKAAGALAALGLTINILDRFTDSAVNSGKGTNELRNALVSLGSGSGSADAFGFTSKRGEVNSFTDALSYLTDHNWGMDFQESVVGFFGASTDLTAARDAVDQVDKALASLVAGGEAEKAAQAYGKLRDQFVAGGGSAETFAGALDDYRDAQAGAKGPTEAATGAIVKQGDAVKTVEHAFKVLQGVLDKGAAKDAWISALQSIGDKASEADGKLGGTSTAALTLRGNLRDSIGSLQSFAEGFTDPTAKAKVLRDGLSKIRDSLVENGISPKDADKFLAPFAGLADRAYDDAKGVGENIGLGVTRGIMNSRARAIAEAEDLGKAAVQGIRRGADVNSPSRYTTWVGKQIVAGLVMGIRDNAPDAESAIAAMTRGAMGAADVSFAGSSSTSGGVRPQYVGAPAGSGPMVIQNQVFLDSKLVQSALVDLKRAQGGSLNF